jgi:FAD/FMN-containing dehydrogenase
MTCDSLLATDLVTASGDIVTASETENPDLFWAVRGAGGGNFGVHTSFTYRVVPTTDVTVFHLTWSSGETAALVDAILQLQLSGPRELGVRLGVGSQSRMPLSQPAPLEVDALGLYWGAATDVAALLAPVEKIQPPDQRIVEQTTFPTAREFLAHTVPIGTYQIKSGFVQGALSPAGIAAMLEWVGKMPGVPSRLPEDSVAIFGFGGKVKDIAPDATAFVHRKDDILFTCSALWEPEDEPDLIAANLAWLEDFYAAMQPYLSGGAYQNFPDRSLRDWRHAYYGENFPRLVAIKRTWDPSNLFHFGQSIPLTT